MYRGKGIWCTGGKGFWCTGKKAFTMELGAIGACTPIRSLIQGARQKPARGDKKRKLNVKSESDTPGNSVTG